MNRVRLALVVAFIVVPALELYVVIRVGQLIGWGPTILLLLVESLLGAWIVKREGLRAFVAVREGLHAGRLPGRELADAAMILVGGTLLLTPGFLTDIVGFVLLLPPTRPLVRRLLLATMTGPVFGRTRFGQVVRQARREAGAHGSTGQGHVVEGEVVDDERTDRRRTRGDG